MPSPTFHTILKVTIGELRTPERAIQALAKHGIIVQNRTLELLRAIPYEQKPRDIPVTWASGTEIGQYGQEPLWKIFGRGEQHSLFELPAEVAPALWLQHSETVMTLPKARLVMPVEDIEGPKRLFLLHHQTVRQYQYRYLDTDFGESYRTMYGRRHWIFGTTRTISTQQKPPE